MHRVRRALALAVPTGALAALAIALPAQAAPQATASCTIQGSATTSPPVALTGGGGTYQFTTGLILACAVTQGTAVDVEDLNIGSQGSYTNTVCGTGTVHSTNAQNTVNSATSRGLPGTTNLTSQWTTPPINAGARLGYDITFAGGQGVLKFSDPTVTGGGAISIAAQPGPGEPNPSANVCTTGFSVAGAISGALS